MEGERERAPVVEVGSPPLGGVPPQGPGELDAVRSRLRELQAALTERFTRQGWDEYVRLRRAARAQHA